MKDLMRNNDLFWCLCLPIIFGCFVWCWNLSRETAQLKGQVELLQMRIDIEEVETTYAPPAFYDDYNYQGVHR